jgi:GT2 family glycosyltransferase
MGSTLSPVAARVSVVVVNFRQPRLTLECLTALAELDSDDVELICVDNASGDESVDLLRGVPGVRLVKAPRNLGFAGGCNLGAAHATGEFVAFLNNDARPHRRWLEEARSALLSDAGIGCVASKVLDWDGERIDYVDAALTWFGMGYKPRAGERYLGTDEIARDVLFATGAAMVMRTRLFEDVGGFDERFFMFYEDVDLGWRLNLLGLRVRYVPTSVVHHRHHATVAAYGPHSEWFLLERNALMALYKNASDETLARVLAPAMALSVRRALAEGGSDPTVLDLEAGVGDDNDSLTVSKRSLTAPFAISSFVDQLPSLSASRAEIQARRVRSDRELRPLLRNALEPALAAPAYLEAHGILVEAFGIGALFAERQHVLVVTGDPVSARLAGPAIRALHIAEALAVEHDVRLVSTSYADLERDDFVVVARRPGLLDDDVAWADVVVFQGFLLAQAPWIADTDKILVVDLYDPMHLEQLEQTRGDESRRRERDLSSTVAAVSDQLRRGDFFLCANEAQRHFWLGHLGALGRLNSRTHDADRSLRSLIAVVPFGLPTEPPTRTRPALRDGAFPGIDADSRVILWGGGIYDWLDPGTLVRAVALLADRRDAVRLVFLGTSHPNPDVPEMRSHRPVQELASSLGLTGKHVFFNEGWVEFEHRQDYLLDADVGVSTHFDSAEATFSFRTRILDYLWAGLPVVITEGDSFAALVRERGAGIVVPAGDVEALAEALEKCLFDEEFAARCSAVARDLAEDLTWDRVLAPLVEFVRSPGRAPDCVLPARTEHDAPAVRAWRDRAVAARRTVGRARLGLRRLRDRE